MKDFIHQQHRFDLWPLCWGIHEIVQAKRAQLIIEYPMLAMKREEVNCPFCINIRNGGRGRFSGFASSRPGKQVAQNG